MADRTRFFTGDLPALQIDRSFRRSIALYNEDPLRFAEQAVGMGEIVALRFGRLTPAYILNDPDVARSMLITEAKSWKRPPATVIPIRMALGENLFTQSERDWALLQPALAPDFRKRALELRLAEVPALVGEEVAALPFDTDIDFDQAMGRIALMVATWVLFGESLSEVEPMNWSLINGWSSTGSPTESARAKHFFLSA